MSWNGLPFLVVKNESPFTMTMTVSPNCLDCAMQLNNVELRDPAACWGCAEQKLGNLCVVRCP